MPSPEVLKKTPLQKEHLKLNARMVPFGGWDMPLQYEGILAEYAACREQTAVFDTSHMGEFYLKGDCVGSGLDRLVTSRISDMPLQTCRYGTTLNLEGGVLDDLIVYRIGQEEWMIVVNAGTMEKDVQHFIQNLTRSADFKNISQSTGKLDIQGPDSQEALKILVPGIAKLEYYTFDYFEVLGEGVIVSRTGYTGELGYEIYFPWEKMPELWSALFRQPNIKPAGLGVRDVLRIEMGYSLYGHELDETISPLEAGLSKFVDFEKDFIGREALIKQKSAGIKRKMVYFASDNRKSPRSNYRIFSTENRPLGVVTSGTFSPILKKGIGMGFIEREFKGNQIVIGDEKNTIRAALVSRPFYKAGSLKT